MRITKRNRTGGRLLALLMSCCLPFSGFFPGAVTAAGDTDEEALVLDKRVEKTEEGFKLTLESYATGEDGAIEQKPLPLDIALVLDESGSMADVLIHGCNNENGADVNVTPRGHLADGVTLDDSQMDKMLFVGHKVFGDSVDPSKTYTVVYPADGTTRDLYYCADCKAVGTRIRITRTILILQSGFLLTMRMGLRQKCVRMVSGNVRFSSMSAVVKPGGTCCRMH